MVTGDQTCSTSRYVKQSGLKQVGAVGKGCPYNFYNMNQDTPSYKLLYIALMLFGLLLTASTCNGQDTTRRQMALEPSYHMFTNVRSTQLGLSSNTDAFFGAKSGNVSIGIGYVRQIYSALQRTTDFQAFTPQARIKFGESGFFYLGPSTTIYRVNDYVETGYGLELGLFITN